MRSALCIATPRRPLGQLLRAEPGHRGRNHKFPGGHANNPPLRDSRSPGRWHSHDEQAHPGCRPPRWTQRGGRSAVRVAGSGVNGMVRPASTTASRGPEWKSPLTWEARRTRCGLRELASTSGGGGGGVSAAVLTSENGQPGKNTAARSRRSAGLRSGGGAAVSVIAVAESTRTTSTAVVARRVDMRQA